MNRVVENYLRFNCYYHQNLSDKLHGNYDFAYNSSVPDDLRTSSSEAYLGWSLESPLDLVTSKSNCEESITEFMDRLKSKL